jgi:uncharacterized protein
MTNSTKISNDSLKKENLKASKYNFFFSGEEDYILAYNAFSNSFARIIPEKYEIVKQILASPSDISSDNIEQQQLLNGLIKGGFLINRTIDEFKILRAQNLIGRFSNRSLTLTVAPTLACNFKCSYCFEKPKGDAISMEVEKALIRFVSNRLPKMDSLNVSWFGGEPLLGIDIIERLTNAFVEECKKHDVRWRQGEIVTNGFLLTPTMVNRLKDLSISGVQVTIDGIEAVHDKRRHLKNGNGTFKKILENVKAASETLRIVVRINIDRDNVDEIDSFLDLWNKEGLRQKIPFYFGQVQSNTEACADISSQCFSSREYSDLLVKLSKKAQEKGFSIAKYPSLHKMGYCMADNLNGYVIAPSGLIFKCWEEISAEVEDSVGTVFSDETDPIQIMNSAKYLNWDPFVIDSCKNCNVFPICSGGCVYNGLNTPNRGVEECSPWKHTLHDLLRIKYKEEINK